MNYQYPDPRCVKSFYFKIEVIIEKFPDRTRYKHKMGNDKNYTICFQDDDVLSFIADQMACINRSMEAELKAYSRIRKCNICDSNVTLTNNDAGTEREMRGICTSCMQRIDECDHRNRYHFHDNAPPYCPACKTYVEV